MSPGTRQKAEQEDVDQDGHVKRKPALKNWGAGGGAQLDSPAGPVKQARVEDESTMAVSAEGSASVSEAAVGGAAFFFVYARHCSESCRATNYSTYGVQCLVPQLNLTYYY